MRLYMIPLVGMCLAVDGLLLLTVKRLRGSGCGWGRMLLAASLGALYAGMCALQGGVMERIWMRFLVLAAVGVVAFGCRDVRSVVIYVVLNLALTGPAMNGALFEQRMLLVVLVVVLVFAYADGGGRKEMRIALRYGDKEMLVNALHDTGNLLRDPLTGERVLVAGGFVAKSLLGLEQRQLADPVETLKRCTVPGMRLVPYKSVGGSGFLLAVTMLVGRQGSPGKRVLVAFAPYGLDVEGKYHALAGGVI